jgi:hypothetical protein
MAISANTLFHFTSKKDNIKGILKNHFFPKYSLEDLSNVIPGSQILAAHIPMVCFCDLPFSQIKNHIDFYGDYGIGLKKKGWGIGKGISPIFYIPKGSNSAKLIKSTAALFKTANKDSNPLTQRFPDFFKYTKSYGGLALNKRTTKMENREFYNEREWRFTPNNFPVLEEKGTKESFLIEENMKMENGAQLTFKAKDIKYIIIKKEFEIPEFVDFIENDLKEQFEEHERKLLVSKLISVQQIRDDM